jgi:hypothetical protein
MRHNDLEIHRWLNSAKFTRVCRLAGWPVREGLAEFSRVLASADSEKPVQEFLEQNLWIVAARWAPWCAWVRPEAPFGSRYRADFLVARTDSYPPLAWTMVELESPKAALYTQQDREASKLREGLAQIKEWRRWLTDYGDIARAPVVPGGEGMGYRYIDRGARGVVVIGRRAAMSPSDQVNRRNSELDGHLISITTYDSMIDKAARWPSSAEPCEECERLTGTSGLEPARPRN